MTYLKNYVAATMLLGCSHAVWAEQSPVVLRDDVLTLPQAVVMDGDDLSHFRNVELTQGANGNFAITASEPGNLAQVESVEILIVLTSWPRAFVLPVSVLNRQRSPIMMVNSWSPFPCLNRPRMCV